MSSVLNSSNLNNSNYNQNYNINPNTNNNSSVFDYLIKKLDSRIKSLHKTRIAINNIVDMNELRENKVYMSHHFQDIEDEINQAIHSLKALLTQNVDVSEHSEICLKKARGFELKLISEAKANIELKHVNENLSKEIFELKSTLEEKNSLIAFLNEKIAFYENKLQLKDKEILDIKGENEHRDEQIKRLFKEIEILNVELDAKNFNAAEGFGSDRAQEKELDIDNLKGILSERENKKKLINEKIKEHINNNSKSSKRTKSDKNKSYEVNYTDNSKYQYPLQIRSERNRKSNFDPEELKKSNNSKGSKLSKHDLISELIIKITSTPENIDYLNKKFGNDFMNKIFSPETEESFLRALEKALEEKNATQRTGNFAASFGQKEDLESNRFKNQSNPYKKNSVTHAYNNSSDDNSSPEKDSNYLYTKGSSSLKRHITTIKNEITNNSSFNKYKNNDTYNNKNYNNSKVFNNTKKSVYLNPFEERISENKQLNKSVNDLLPGKNYAKNILCKSIGERFRTPIGNVFEKNLRFYGSTGQNTDINRSYAKSSDKKHFNNYFAKNPKTFEELSKTNKIQALNKSSTKKSNHKNPENSKQEYFFKDSNSHDISFSNNNNNNNIKNNNDNNNQFNNINKNEKENIPNDNISTNRSNHNNNDNNSNMNYLRKYENFNNSNNNNKNLKEKSNIVINEDYNYPYSSGNDKGENEDNENLNEQIDEFIKENFKENNNNDAKKNPNEKFGYLGTHHSQKEQRSEKDNKKNYNFESDRVSLDKNHDANEDNLDDIDMEALKNSIYNNLSERDMQ